MLALRVRLSLSYPTGYDLNYRFRRCYAAFKNRALRHEVFHTVLRISLVEGEYAWILASRCTKTAITATLILLRDLPVTIVTVFSEGPHGNLDWSSTVSSSWLGCFATSQDDGLSKQVSQSASGGE